MVEEAERLVTGLLRILSLLSVELPRCNDAADDDCNGHGLLAIVMSAFRKGIPYEQKSPQC